MGGLEPYLALLLDDEEGEDSDDSCYDGPAYKRYPVLSKISAGEYRTEIVDEEADGIAYGKLKADAGEEPLFALYLRIHSADSRKARRGEEVEHKECVDSLAERASNCKRYYFDNALLNNFLVEAEPQLLENIVAIDLVKRYRESESDGVYFYNKGIEVDFYVPNEKMAIQVSYSISDSITREREIRALA